MLKPHLYHLYFQNPIPNCRCAGGILGLYAHCGGCGWDICSACMSELRQQQQQQQQQLSEQLLMPEPQQEHKQQQGQAMATLGVASAVSAASAAAAAEQAVSSNELVCSSTGHVWTCCNPTCQGGASAQQPIELLLTESEPAHQQEQQNQLATSLLALQGEEGDEQPEEVREGGALGGTAGSSEWLVGGELLCRAGAEVLVVKLLLPQDLADLGAERVLADLEAALQVSLTTIVLLTSHSGSITCGVIWVIGVWERRLTIAVQSRQDHSKIKVLPQGQQGM